MGNVSIVAMQDLLTQADLSPYKENLISLIHFITEHDLKESRIALPLAYALHKGQYREGGEIAFSHPLTVAILLMNLIHRTDERSDHLIAAALLHDTIEDTDVTEEGLHGYGISVITTDAVLALSNPSGLTWEELRLYFQKIGTDPISALVKIADRVNNVMTIYQFRSPMRIRKYLSETEDFLLPMAAMCKKAYRDYSHEFETLELWLFSLCNVYRKLI